MIYTVVWENSAENTLADIWNNAFDRDAVTDASNQIDRELRVDAERKGTDLQNRRLFVVPPLAVVFVVDSGDCMVRVLNVRRTDGPSHN